MGKRIEASPKDVVANRNYAVTAGEANRRWLRV